MESIFVSIASFRDQDCSKTLHSLDSKAAEPYQIVYGIVEQNHSDHPEEKCQLSSIRGTVKRIVLDHTQARGPAVARYLASTLYSNETYYFQIDSHMLFVNHWDTKLKSMIKTEYARRNSKANFVFSHYPKAIEDAAGNDDESIVPRICKAVFHSDINTFSQSGAQLIKSPDVPVETPFLAAGCLFGVAKVVLSVPFDPDLQDLFIGEEFLMAIRYFTHGIDILTPVLNLSFHFYTRENRPKYWESRGNERNDAAARLKIQRLLAGERGLEYGLGTQRSVQEFFKFMGINRRLKTIGKDFCREDTSTLEIYDYKQYRIIALSLTSVAAIIIILMLLSHVRLKRTFT